MHHENTRIHARSLELIRIVAKVLKALPAGHGDLGNQLRRASSSIALNFAEVAPGQAWEEANMR